MNLLFPKSCLLHQRRAGRAIRVGTWAKFLLLLYLVATDANAQLRIDGTFQSRHFRVGSGRSEKQNWSRLRGLSPSSHQTEQQDCVSISLTAIAELFVGRSRRDF